MKWLSRKIRLRIGAVLVYRLTAADVKRIIYVGADGTHTHTEGQKLPLIVARIWPDEGGPGVPGVNGQVILDNEIGTLWIKSAREGSASGQWSYA